MKAIFISFNQAIGERIINILDRKGVRGYTRWVETHGRGSFDGEPHYGSHAWPSVNSSILAVVSDDKVKPLMDELRELDQVTQMQGMRAFVWNVEEGL